MYRILAVNPGSTSTKISVSDDENLIFEATINHSREELKKYKRISDQYEMRKDLVIAEVKKHGLPVQFDAIIGRGGLAKPVKSGVFRVNDQMVEDQRKALHQHACDQGCIIAHEIAEEIGCPSFVADPGVVDELAPEAKISGSPLLPRYCIWHALNQKAIARRYAKDHAHATRTSTSSSATSVAVSPSLPTTMARPSTPTTPSTARDRSLPSAQDPCPQQTLSVFASLAATRRTSLSRR